MSGKRISIGHLAGVCLAAVAAGAAFADTYTWTGAASSAWNKTDANWDKGVWVEVSAGTHAIFAGALAFGADATAELDDPSIPLATYTLFTAAGGIAGKPVTTGATAAAGWSVFKRGANTLCIGPAPGTCLTVR